MGIEPHAADRLHAVRRTTSDEHVRAVLGDMLPPDGRGSSVWGHEEPADARPRFRVSGPVAASDDSGPSATTETLLSLLSTHARALWMVSEAERRGVVRLPADVSRAVAAARIAIDKSSE